MTLVELLLASAIMTIIVGVTGTMALAVRQGWQHAQGQADSAQQARVALERIARRVRAAYAAPVHPGVGVANTTVGTYGFPDTLVVWAPAGTPANPSGPPRVNECILFCPSPSDPQQLLEITAPSDTRNLPLDAQLNQSATLSMLDGIKTASTSQKVVLCRLLRTADTAVAAAGSGGSTSTPQLRGAVRFALVLQPSAGQWSEYTAGTRTWNNLSFPLGTRGSAFGLRTVWLRTEMQLVPPLLDANRSSSSETVVAVFGSATRTYCLAK